MKVIKVYKWSLALPLIVPILSAIPLLFVSSNDAEPLGLLSGVIAAIILSGLVGGIPYLILVGLLLWWMRYKNEKQIRRVLILSPILLLPLSLIFITTISLLRFGAEETLTDFSEVLTFYVPFILGFGYGYVALVFGAVFMLRRTGVILPPNSA
jgi:uncharacterized membrane protein